MPLTVSEAWREVYKMEKERPSHQEWR